MSPKNSIQIILFLFLSALSCRSFGNMWNDTPDQLGKFLNLFEDYALHHKTDKMTSLFEPDYKVEMLDDILAGDKAAFIDQFLSGTLKESGQYASVNHQKIVQLELTSIVQNGDQHIATYEIKTIYQIILVKLLIVPLPDSKLNYGFTALLG